MAGAVRETSLREDRSLNGLWKRGAIVEGGHSGLTSEEITSWNSMEVLSIGREQIQTFNMVP